MELRDVVSLVLSIVALVIPLIIFIVSSPEMINVLNITIFVSIGILLIIFSFFVYFISDFNKTKDMVYNNSFEITKMKKSLKDKDLLKDMDVRLRVLESLNKKGQIDPRIIYWILILILLYLFLKTAGIVP